MEPPVTARCQEMRSQNPDTRLRGYRDFFEASTDDRRSNMSWWLIAASGVTDVWSNIRKLAAVEAVPKGVNEAKLLWQLMPKFQSIVGKGDWCACEGICLVVKKTFSSKKAAAFMQEAAGPAMQQRLSVLLWQVVLPLCTHVQLPVRAAATTTLPLLVDATRSDDERSEFISVISSSARKGFSSSQVHDVEGALQVVLLFPTEWQELVENRSRSLAALDNHAAATVRQLVAEIRGGEYGQTVEALADLVHEVSKGESQVPSDSTNAVETLLMALHSRTLRALTQAAVTYPRHGRNVALAVLSSLFAWQRESSFEVRRMATQLLPLFTQLLIRSGCLSEVCKAAEASFSDKSATSDNKALERDQRNHCGSIAWYAAIKAALDNESLLTSLDVIKERSPEVRIATATYDAESKAFPPPSDWSAALQQGITAARYAPDAAALSPATITAQYFTPWSEAFVRSHETAVQCLLVEAITIAIDPPKSHRIFHALTHSDFQPPAVEEDGGGSLSGQQWLELNRDRIPSVSISLHSEEDLKRRRSIFSENNVADSLVRVLAHALPRTSTEPCVVHRVLDMAVNAVDDGIVLPSVVLDNVWKRLSAVSPQWEKGSFPAASSNKASNSNWDDTDDDDDWDNDDDDNNESVAAISVDREMLNAQRVVRRFQSQGVSFEGATQDRIEVVMQYTSPK